jgi:WD40 repeat protein
VIIISTFVFHRPICGAISNEGSTLAYGMSELGIRVCSAASAKKLMDSSGGGEIGDETFPGVKMINGHEGSVYGLNFHPKTKLLFSVGEDKCMRAWDLGNSNNISCKVAYRYVNHPMITYFR